MVEMMLVIAGLAVFLAALSGVVWVLCRVISGFFTLPVALRGHVWAATLWTMTTAGYTLHFALDNETLQHDPLGAAVLLVAGWTMVSSWAQFFERRGNAAILRQSRRPLVARLFVQTVWGVVALGLTAWGLTLYVPTPDAPQTMPFSEPSAFDPPARSIR